ncbi:unnamed protein product [Paramecium sonneborni]|uniref:Transmembrane protein n=1 Tax=Paramecium sonneborni TaxID=65129 RepID=A0A8S1PDU8_9CILI|nr:unnamed protein product [Paramecium sonneborni]
MLNIFRKFKACISKCITCDTKTEITNNADCEYYHNDNRFKQGDTKFMQHQSIGYIVIGVVKDDKQTYQDYVIMVHQYKNRLAHQLVFHVLIIIEMHHQNQMAPIVMLLILVLQILFQLLLLLLINSYGVEECLRIQQLLNHLFIILMQALLTVQQFTYVKRLFINKCNQELKCEMCQIKLLVEDVLLLKEYVVFILWRESLLLLIVHLQDIQIQLFQLDVNTLQQLPVNCMSRIFADISYPPFQDHVIKFLKIKYFVLVQSQFYSQNKIFQNLIFVFNIDLMKHTNCEQDLKGFGQIQNLILQLNKRNLENQITQLKKSFASFRNKFEEYSQIISSMKKQLINVSECLIQQEYQFNQIVISKKQIFLRTQLDAFNITFYLQLIWFSS